MHTFCEWNGPNTLCVIVSIHRTDTEFIVAATDVAMAITEYDMGSMLRFHRQVLKEQYYQLSHMFTPVTSNAEIEASMRKVVGTTFCRLAIQPQDDETLKKRARALKIKGLDTSLRSWLNGEKSPRGRLIAIGIINEI